jgi:hypothetical protein
VIRRGCLLTAQAIKFAPSTNNEEAERIYAGSYRRIIDRLAELPGVVAVSGGNDLLDDKLRSFDIAAG